MKIQQVSVSKLFGLFDHIIPLNSEDRITLLLGENGLGKTIILKMIDGIFNRRYSIFNEIPFGLFEIKFDDDRFIEVSKESNGSNESKLIVRGPYANEKPFNMTPQSIKNLSAIIRDLERHMPELLQAERNLWVNRVTDEMLTIDDMVEYYGRFFGSARSVSRQRTPDWLEEIQKQLNIEFIQTNRLSINTSAKLGRASGSPRRNHPGDSVDEYSQDLASKIRDALTKSAEISSSLDSTFPSRLMKSISQDAAPPFSEEELREELRKLQIKRADLTDAGLLDRDMADVQIPDQRVEGFTLNALSIYISDAKEKLQVFDDLLRRVDLFRDIIKRRFLYKTLSVSKQEGFVFKSGDSKIPLGSLSSGEQHEIVLLYELLFRVQPDSLILIDEPEISLHIAWQQEFLRDLLQITKISEFDALIATHSPDIIHDRWDLTVNLQGPAEQTEEVEQMQVND